MPPSRAKQPGTNGYVPTTGAPTRATTRGKWQKAASGVKRGLLEGAGGKQSIEAEFGGEAKYSARAVATGERVIEQGNDASNRDASADSHASNQRRTTTSQSDTELEGNHARLADDGQRSTSGVEDLKDGTMAPGFPPAADGARASLTERSNDDERTTEHWKHRLLVSDEVLIPPAHSLGYVSDPPGEPASRSRTVTLQSQDTRQQVQQETEAREAEHDVRAWRERKSKERQLREQEQRKDLQMLQDYKPWGKPGCGAPKAGIAAKQGANIHRTTATDSTDRGGYTSQHPHVSHDQSGSGSYYCNHSKTVEGMSLPMGSRFGGGGEVSRTNSGRARTRLPAHPETRFQDHGELSPSSNRLLRSSILDGDGGGLSARQRYGRPRRLPTVDEQGEAFFPFGRPGCGAPLKTDTGVIKTTLQTSELDGAQREHLEQRRREALRYRDQLDQQAVQKKDASVAAAAPGSARSQQECYDPWGKGTGNVPRDSAGFNRLPVRIRNPIDTALSPDKISTVADTLRRQRTLYGNADIVSMTALPPPPPHPVATANTDLENTDALLAQQEKHIYLQSMRDAAELKRSERLRNRQAPATAGDTTADWMTSMQVGRPRRDPLTDKLVPSDRRGLSDLYAHGSESCLLPRRREEAERVEMRAQLAEQAEQRQRVKKEDREREKEEVEKHMDTLDGMFGRPGCGAPLRDGHGRLQAGRTKSNELAVEGYKSDTTAVRM